MEHYIGRIFDFNESPETENILIDIPFFEQNPISDEVLIQLNKKDVKNKDSDQYKLLEKIPQEEKALFKRNGVSIKGQKQILDYLKGNILHEYNLIFWNGSPSYEQLKYAMFLAWDNLIKKGETTKPMTKNKLIKVTFDYGIKKNIIYLIKSNYSYLRKQKDFENKTNEEVLDKAIKDAFPILRHWFHYKVPKWLNVINELQKYVCEINGLKPGDYSFYASQIENDFVRGNLSILVEYGIPKSAITKLEKHIPKDLNEDFVFDIIRGNKLIERAGLIEYEKEKIIDNL